MSWHTDEYVELVLKVALTVGVLAACLIMLGLAGMFIAGALTFLGILPGRDDEEEE